MLEFLIVLIIGLGAAFGLIGLAYIAGRLF
jgi:hypothetical protein